MTYATWTARYRVTTIPPGRLDLFVLTFIDGRRAGLQPVTEYDAALTKARNFAADHKCQVKVLPMTGSEVRNLLGLKRPEAPALFDPVERKEVIDCLRDVVRGSNDEDARRDAYDLFVSMGVLQDA